MENKELILKAIRYAKHHFSDTDMSVENVADHAGFSMDYFNRIFLAHTGYTVMSYVNRMRCQKAILLLRNTEKTILDIALEVGYDSHEGFIKAFKKIYDVTPSDYRKQKKDTILSWSELTDSDCVHRFLHEHTDFQQVDADVVIDHLLEKDWKRYSYFCTTIKNMGLAIIAPNGDYQKGLIGIGDNRDGTLWLELVSDNLALLSEWVTRFSVETVVHSIVEPTEMQKTIPYSLTATPQALYLGEPLPCSLPSNTLIRPLTYADSGAIEKWAGGKRDGYVLHLLNEQHYNDPATVEYGVFDGDELIAIAGGWMDSVCGLRMNNCCNIRFADCKATDVLYRNVFAYITNDLLGKDIIPFDDIQHGEYAQVHGNFTAVDMGYTIVNWRYEVERR